MVTPRVLKAFRGAIWRQSGFAPTFALGEEPTASLSRYNRGRRDILEAAPMSDVPRRGIMPIDMGENRNQANGRKHRKESVMSIEFFFQEDSR